MKTEAMIKELRRLAEKHKNDMVGTCEIKWSAMCNDVADRLEKQEKEIVELKSKLDNQTDF